MDEIFHRHSAIPYATRHHEPPDGGSDTPSPLDVDRMLVYCLLLHTSVAHHYMPGHNYTDPDARACVEPGRA
eukprot:1528077-Prymnesium_polylepis.1